MRYSVKLSYSGAAFCGWQRQPDAPSVQQALEEAISTLTGAPVSVTGAGRTDTAVNAIGYVASFEAREGLDTPDFCYKLNAILPAEICVHEVAVQDDEFNARFSARRREYCYFLHRRKDPFIASYSYLYGYPNLDFDAMNRAAEALLGTHDFSCFEKSGSDNKTSVCTVFEAGWHPYTPTHAALMGGREGGPFAEVFCEGPERGGSGAKGLPSASDYWYFRIAADRFLRNMVRAVVGTLLEVGRGKRSADSIATLIDGGTRSDSGESVPGHALFLSRIDY